MRTAILKYIWILSLVFPVFAKTPNSLCNSPQGTNFPAGDGSVGNPYLICTTTQLSRLASEPALLTQNFILGADLDFTSNAFNIIGSKTNAYQGIFNGNDYTLSTINLPGNSSYIAPFARLNHATIQNLIIRRVTITGWNTDHVGGLAALAENSTIINVQVRGLNIKAPDYSGGLIGEAKYSSVINSSTGGTLFNSSSTDGSGGLIGVANNSTISACSSIATLKEFTHSAFGVNSIGGLIGAANNSNISNVYARGTIDYSSVTDSSKPSDIGGLIGYMYNSNIINAFYAGKLLIVADHLGGAVGLAEFHSSGQNVYWDFELSGVNASSIGVGENTTTLKTASFWTNNNFPKNIWSIANGRYPYLYATNL